MYTSQKIGVCGANDNTQWKWVWKHGGNEESVAKKGGCCNSSGTLSKCYSGIKVVHQAPKWCHQHDALLVQAHRRMGGGWTNTKGPGEEMEMVILKKYKR